MRKAAWWLVFAAAVVAAAGRGSGRAEDLGPAIDLTNLGREELPQQPVWEGPEIESIGLVDRILRPGRRVYLSGMIGPSFVTLADPADPSLDTTDTVFTAGGALGLAIDRRRGRLRLELEGLARNDFVGPYNDGTGDAAFARSNWSVMQNLWRDIMLTSRFGIYGGGGLGAGGYRDGDLVGGQEIFEDPASSFAWQFGGGVIYEVSDRLTADVGYRYFHIDKITFATSDPSQYSASELLFTLRVYEPFRQWRN